MANDITNPALVPGFSFGVVILAAGSSTRMGQPKLLLPWSGTTVIGQLIRRWTDLGAQQIAIVCAADAPELYHELDRLGFPDANRIFNRAPERGMFSSIKCAAAWTGWNTELTHCLTTLGDQPHLRPESLRALLEFAAMCPDKICQPIRNGRRKHPVLMPMRVFRALADSSASDLKQFLQEHADKLAGFNSEDEGLDLDMDTPADYERLKPF